MSKKLLNNKGLADNLNSVSNDKRPLLFDNLNIRLLSTREASYILGVSEIALRTMVHRRQIKFYKLGHRLRFKYADLIKDLQKMEVFNGN